MNTHTVHSKHWSKKWRKFYFTLDLVLIYIKVIKWFPNKMTDQCSAGTPGWWEVMGVTWSDRNAVLMTSLGDTVSVILLTHLLVEYKVKCPHIVKLKTQRIRRKWHNDLKYIVSDMNVNEYFNMRALHNSIIIQRIDLMLLQRQTTLRRQSHNKLTKSEVQVKELW